MPKKIKKPRINDDLTVNPVWMECDKHHIPVRETWFWVYGYHEGEPFCERRYKEKRTPEWSWFDADRYWIYHTGFIRLIDGIEFQRYADEAIEKYEQRKLQHTEIRIGASTKE